MDKSTAPVSSDGNAENDVAGDSENKQAEETWSNDYLVCRLKQQLCTVDLKSTKVKTNSLDSGGNYDTRKYYNQAHDYLKVGAFKRPPPFLISLSDLPDRLVKELAELENRDRVFVLKQAIGRIFEDVNGKLYHDSVSRVLEIGLVE